MLAGNKKIRACLAHSRYSTSLCWTKEFNVENFSVVIKVGRATCSSHSNDLNSVKEKLIKLRKMYKNSTLY